MQDHMVPFTYKGKAFVVNMDTRRVLEVADIQLPSFNEAESAEAYIRAHSGVSVEEAYRRVQPSGAEPKLREVKRMARKAPKGKYSKEVDIHVVPVGKRVEITLRLSEEAVQKIFPKLKLVYERSNQKSGK